MYEIYSLECIRLLLMYVVIEKSYGVLELEENLECVMFKFFYVN